MRLDQLLDLEQDEHLQFLDHIQGNILKFHGRNYSALIFITVRYQESQAGVSWLIEEARNRVITGRAHINTSISYAAELLDGGPFETLSISPSGYRKLGISPDKWPTETRYRYGMKGVRTSRPGIPFKDIPLHDPPFGEWEKPFRNDLDLLVLLADDDKSRLQQDVERVLQAITPFTQATHVEWGSALFRENQRIEHFGYVDGISSPIFIKQDVDREVTNRGAQSWNPSANLDIVLSPDFQASTTYGSYLVVRKLEQNVALFNETLETLATELSLQNDIEAAAGLIVGRRRDGTPIVDHYTPPAPGDYANDFQFDQDPLGMTCPFHSHIRKVNPRGDIHRADSTQQPEEDLIAFERRRQLARRGITYGDRPDLTRDGSPAPERGVGLLFMGYGRGIFSFELWQQTAEEEHFLRKGTGVDPLIAQNPRPFMQEWPCEAAVEKVRRAHFFGCVRLLGGEYFFTPSLDFLQSLDRFLVEGESND